jgi:hypothetical protein
MRWRVGAGMQSTITISVWGLAGIFVLGALAGWLVGKLRAFGNVSFSVNRAATDSALYSGVEFSKTVRVLKLKCNCGETLNFHATDGHPDQRSQPIPEGDSIGCPKCGRMLDLRDLRKAEGAAAALPSGK